MLFTLPFKKYPAASITVLIFVVLEILVRTLPSMKYGLHPEVFLVHERRDIMEDDHPCYDYIIFGDSRSLSLNGRASSNEDYSVYNLSLPGMDPRYYAEYLKKYLKHRTCKPKAVIFAATPQYYLEKTQEPLHDPDRRYTKVKDQSMIDFFKARIFLRLEQPFTRIKSERSSISNEMLWEAFSHRLMHTFSIAELSDIYTGPERIFVIREAIPLLYATYKYRDAVKTFTVDLTSSHFRKLELPAICNTCSAIETLRECHPEKSRVQDNRMIEELMGKNYGGINLSDRMDPLKRVVVTHNRKELIEDTKDSLSKVKVEYNLTPIEYLADVASANRIDVALIVTPHPDLLSDLPYMNAFFSSAGELQKKHENIRIFRFPKEGYPENLFSEQTHYNCEGAKELNRDFYGYVFPKIVRSEK